MEEAGGLQDVYIYDNVCNHSILASGPTGMWIVSNTVEGQILCNLDKQLTIANNLILSHPSTGGCKQDEASAETGQSVALIASDFTAGITISNNTLVHRSDCDPRWAGQIGIQLVGGVEHYPNMSDVLIEGNQFRLEGATTNTILIDLEGCDGVVVRANDFGLAGGTAATHVKKARCTNCTIEPPAPSLASSPVSSAEIKGSIKGPIEGPMEGPSEGSIERSDSWPCAGDSIGRNAVPDDDKDDTAAIQSALNGCVAAGGSVCIPAGTYIISLPTKPNVTDLCLAIPSDCTLRGEGPASILKYAPEVNKEGWWRMLGPALVKPAGLPSGSAAQTEESPGSASNITISDLRLDGSTTHTAYPCSIPMPGNASKPYFVCEHNSLIFFYTPAPGVLRDITVQRMITEAIAGDCMNFGDGVQNLLVQDIQLRDYLRQGVDLAGNSLSRNHTVRRVTELPWQVVTKPGGSTLHIEEATGLRDVVLHDCVVNHSILASTVINLTIRDNIVHGMIEANSNTDLSVENNTIFSEHNCSMLQMLSPQRAFISGNTFHSDPTLELAGVYVWGKDEGYPAASNLTIDANTFVGSFDAQGKALHFYGVDGVAVLGNTFLQSPDGATAENNSCVCCRQPKKVATLCVDVHFGE